MSVLSDLLDFFKYDPSTDGASTFNIELALNQNWDKIRTFAAQVAASDLSNVDKTAIASIIEKAVQSGDLAAGDVGADPAGAAQVVQGNLQTHMGDGVKHITTAERTAWNGKQAALTFDSAPTAGSGNPVTSAGVKTALDGKSATGHTHPAGDITGTLSTALLPTVPVAKGGTGATTAPGARANLEVSKPVWAEVTLPVAGWTLTDGVYVQTVACAAAKAEMKGYPSVGLKKSTDAAARELEKEAYALIETVDTLDGSVKVACGDKAPQVAITLLFSGGVA